MTDFNNLGTILERIANNKESNEDINRLSNILIKLGVNEEQIQTLLEFVRSHEQTFKPSESKQRNLQIIVQNIVQLGEKSNNFGTASNFTIENHQGIDTETFNATFKEFQETIQKIIFDKIPLQETKISSNASLPNENISKKSLLSNDLGCKVFLPPSPLAISTFNFEIVKVDKQGKITKRYIDKAESFVEDLNNGVVLEMVSIPNGSFIMGTPKDETATTEDERPKHLVTLKSFFFGKYPITQAQWREITYFPKIKYELESEPSYFKGDNLPVECVSWHEAQEFCARLSQKTGRVYRLPSEAEWEYACRANTTALFFFGATITKDLANYCEKQQTHLYWSQTTKVGIFPANSFGLYDMHGNVWEWCADYQHDDYQGAPSDGSVWEIDGNPEYRMLRGGSWDDDFSYCRSASRYFENPSTRNKSFGFRVVYCS